MEFAFLEGRRTLWLCRPVESYRNSGQWLGNAQDLTFDGDDGFKASVGPEELDVDFDERRDFHYEMKVVKCRACLELFIPYLLTNVSK